MNTKSNAKLHFLLIIIIIIAWNIIASLYFFRIDLTEDKRYTLSQQSKNVLENLEDQVYIEVFLDGDLPAGFKRFQKTIREFLDESSIFANGNIQYTFSDPLANDNNQKRQKYFQQLANRGLQPTNIFTKKNGKQIEKLVFPGAIINYKGKETPINLLKNSTGSSPLEALNQSEENIEYELISAIKKLSENHSKRIGFSEGHGELSNLDLQDISQTLAQNNTLTRVSLLKNNNLNNFIDLLIIAKPTKPFSDAEKLILDQYIVKGGKIIFFIDKINVSLAVLEDGKTIAIPYEFNLEDLFFKLGFRLNQTLYLDLQSSMIPMVVGMQGNQPQTQLMPWLYYPVFTHFSTHPIVKNMAAVAGKFLGSIDTVKAVGIKKTPLMYTSKYSKEIQVPAEIDLSTARKQPNPKEFQNTEQPVGYLLEGKFKSLFTNRLTDTMIDSIQFKSESLESKIIVFSDGDLLRNDVSPDGKQTLPLGFDRYVQKKMANKELVLNCIDYMLDNTGLVSLRAKELILRPLDKQKITSQRTKWQLINVGLPIILVVFFGIAKYYFRKKKFEI